MIRAVADQGEGSYMPSHTLAPCPRPCARTGCSPPPPWLKPPLGPVAVDELARHLSPIKDEHKVYPPGNHRHSLLHEVPHDAGVVVVEDQLLRMPGRQLVQPDEAVDLQPPP